MRLIDADALIEMCKRQKDSWDHYARPYAWGTVYDIFVDYLEDAPTIDPESLHPKGEWEEVTIGRWIYAHCPYCNTTHDVKSNFCPNCGRDMGDIKDD